MKEGSLRRGKGRPGRAEAGAASKLGQKDVLKEMPEREQLARGGNRPGKGAHRERDQPEREGEKTVWGWGEARPCQETSCSHVGDFDSKHKK